MKIRSLGRGGRGGGREGGAKASDCLPVMIDALLGFFVDCVVVQSCRTTRRHIEREPPIYSHFHMTVALSALYNQY